MTLNYEDFEKMYRDEHGNIPFFDYICKKDLGILNNPKADKLMSYAWQEGHAHGYYNVYQIASELIGLIQYNEGPFKVVNVHECKREINNFMNNPGDVLRCIDRHVVNADVGEE